MKSKKLIALIQKCDPTGEMEVCIGNGDIHHVGVEPAYWDGKLQVFTFDENGYPISAKRVSKGEKMTLDPIYISDTVGEYDNFVVEYTDDAELARYEHIDQEHARRRVQIDLDLDREAFADWVFRRIQTIRKVPMGWVDRIKAKAYEFFDANKMGPDSPIIKVRQGKSFSDCREEHFEEAFIVDWDDYSRIIIQNREPKTKTELT